MPPLILHLTTFLQGGAGRAITTLARAQRRRGNSVVVATSLTPEPGFENYREYVDALRASGVTLIEVDSLFKRDAELNASAIAAIERTLAGRQPDIIHAHAAIPAKLGRHFRQPVVQTMHGWSRNKSTAHTNEDLGIMREIDMVVFPSKASLSELESIGAEFRSTGIVPYGIGSTLPESHGALTEIGALRASGKRVLMTIGSLTPQKNHAIVIEALPAILQRHDVACVLVGEGPQLNVLSERARALGVTDRVHFTGYVSEAATALAHADLLIQPSLTESFGIAVVEAFRAGVPVVASTIPALHELVGDTACGWLFDPHSAMSLACSTHAALESTADDRGAIVERGRRLFEERFTEERMIAGYDAVYDRLTGSGRL